MSDPYNKPQEDQEADLLPVFEWIGNGFKNLGRGIANLFKAIIHGILLFFVFLQRNIILIGVFVLIGLGLGYYMDQQVKDKYSALVRVEPNFNSVTQLISNVKYYNALVEEGVYDKLAKELDITTVEAENLSGFYIEPSYNDTELLKEYDELARRSDTMALENFSFEGFKEAKREIDYQYYEITASSKDRATLVEIIDDLVKVEVNAAIKGAKQSTLENTEFDIKALNYQLQELDSLISGYQKAITAQDIPVNAGTTLYLGDQKPSDALTQLFDEKRIVLAQLNELRETKYLNEDTVNIQSQFITRGTIEKKHLKLKYLLVFFGLGLLIAIIPTIWKFLKNYPDSQQTA
ncbi:hypothetical protein [Nonlabens ponticola]|uniref:Uncharacterized protein n=1 Tax=Nonlabens ponticola TaxID=2496866 RepID=A0A3S9MVC4_9FLAO|nr:hypothetical protein [Nonlabens ponticola]AZQ43128.1 hypothetical protein EJ995_02340 [Nonlabens ponticola]